MGAAHSSEPRSVSMDNPNPSSAGVIDISDDVVNRLKKGITKQGMYTHMGSFDSPVSHSSLEL